MKSDKLYGAPGSHNYEAVYRTMFGLDGLKGKRVFEIGVMTGISLKWWFELGASYVVGVDIDKRGAYVPNSAHFLRGNAYTEEFVKKIGDLGTFDLIVDDGPHTKETQGYAAEHYSPLLNPNGLFIVEDIWSADDANYIYSKLPAHLQRTAFFASTEPTSSKAPYPSNMLVAQNR